MDIRKIIEFSDEVSNDPIVQEALNKLEEKLEELNLTQEQAQRIIELVHDVVQARIDSWGEKIKNTPELCGAELNQAKHCVRRAILNLGGKSLLHVLTTETGAINHPAVWKAFLTLDDYFLNNEKKKEEQ